jgi:hypothetical protein
VLEHGYPRGDLKIHALDGIAESAFDAAVNRRLAFSMK